MTRSPIAGGFSFVLASALLVPIHFLVGDRSFGHVVLRFVAIIVFLVTLSIGLLAIGRQRRMDEKRSRFLEPALAALAVGILYGLCTPVICILP
jgi:cytochrome c biogenesis factor